MAIRAKLTAQDGGGVEAPLTRTGTALDVSAAALPLPAGAATSALQVTGNVSLAYIVTALQSVLRPGQGTGRTYRTAQANGVAGATVYTPPPATVLYVQTLIVTAFNTSAAASGLLSVRDGAGTILFSLVIPIAGTGFGDPVQTPGGLAVTFPEPLQVATDLRVTLDAGTLTWALAMVGYTA